MSYLPRSVWRLSSREFECRGCGGKDAFRSRPRGLFERYVLPMLSLLPVRCDRCYRRSYVRASVAVRERSQAERKRPQSQLEATTERTSRTA